MTPGPLGNGMVRPTIWLRGHKFDRDCLPLADRHYNRRKVGSPQFVPPGRALVLKTPCLRAVWVTSWPFAEYVRHAWPGAWVNSLFRNEGAGLSSDLIREAVAETIAHWPSPPELGMVTFVDASKVRHKRDPGRCYRKAGFRHVGFTKGGLWAFQMLPSEMPAGQPPIFSLRPSAANSTATSSRPCLRPGFGRGAFYTDGEA